MKSTQHSQPNLFQLEKLPVLLLIYCGASFFHFAHNAIFIDDYPNMPPTTTAIKVVIGWLGITSIGIMGYLLMHRRRIFPSLVLYLVYSAWGLYGLGHYVLAPISDHTFMMNFSIWSEAVTGSVAMFVIVREMSTQCQNIKRLPSSQSS